MQQLAAETMRGTVLAVARDAQTRTAMEASSTSPSRVLDNERAEARLKGYVGEACSECGNFTMVRNGTCLKCDTCGSTSGCS
jgi:ribonucleoside-diphosphate reductase alpha chain